MKAGGTDMNAGTTGHSAGAADISVGGTGVSARAPGAGERRIVLLDRDGTLNEETPDEQIDSLEKVRLMPGVVAALLELKAAGFAFVMVTNQDGLGTPSFPQEDFDRAHRFILDLFSSQGIEFEAVCICPHFKREDCADRKSTRLNSSHQIISSAVFCLYKKTQ